MPMWSSQGKSPTVIITVLRSGEDTADRENWLENGFVFSCEKRGAFYLKQKHLCISDTIKIFPAFSHWRSFGELGINFH